MSAHGNSTILGVSIGINDPAFTVGKRKVLAYINDVLDLNYKKIEETANGPRST